MSIYNYTNVSTNTYSNNSSAREDILMDWDHFTRFGSLYFYKQNFRNNSFTNYFVLATRGNVMVTSSRAIRDLFCRISGFFSLQRECLKWLFTDSPRYVALARWFGWETGSDVYMQLDRRCVVICSSDVCYAITSRYITYRFLYLIGCDVAFVLSSFDDDSRYLEFQGRGIPTIGFNDGDVCAYTYGFPGGTGHLTTLTYLRVLVQILVEVRSSHIFWHLNVNRFVI